MGRFISIFVFCVQLPVNFFLLHNLLSNRYPRHHLTDHEPQFSYHSTPTLNRYIKLSVSKIIAPITLGIGYERRWVGGKPETGTPWAVIGIKKPASNKWLLGSNLQLWRKNHDEGDNAYGKAMNLNAKRKSGLGSIRFGIALAREDAKIENWRSVTPSIFYSTKFQRGLKLNAMVVWARKLYKKENALFGIRRDDRTVSFVISVSHRTLSRNGYLPEATFEWNRIRSNINLYDRKTQQVRIGLTRIF